MPLSHTKCHVLLRKDRRLVCLKIVWSRTSQTVCWVLRNSLQKLRRGEMSSCVIKTVLWVIMCQWCPEMVSHLAVRTVWERSPQTLLWVMFHSVLCHPELVSHPVTASRVMCRSSRVTTGTLDLRFKGPYQCREHHGEVLYPSRHGGHHGEVFSRLGHTGEVFSSRGHLRKVFSRGRLRKVFSRRGHPGEVFSRRGHPGEVFSRRVHCWEVCHPTQW